MAHNSLGHAAQQHMLHAGSTVRGQNDHVRLRPESELGDGLPCSASTHVSARPHFARHRPMDQLRQFVFGDLAELAPVLAVVCGDEPAGLCRLDDVEQEKLRIESARKINRITHPGLGAG